MLRLSTSSDFQDRGTRRLKRTAAICAATMLLAGCSGQNVQNNASGNQGGNATPCPNPLQPAQHQQVHLIWQQASNDWMVQINGDSAKKPNEAKSVLAACTAPAKFTVDIVGNTSAFFKDQDGLDVWEGDGKKSQPQSGINSSQILGPDIDKQGRLIFYDLNQGDPVTLNYRLNFNNGVKSVDPIIDNGGGVSE